MSADDLAQVLAWRNHPDVRRHMFVTRDIELDEHRRWFASIDADPRRHALVLETADGDAGFVNIGPVADGGIAGWGFYVAPGAAKGTGTLLGTLALAYAFDQLGLHKLCGEVLAGNESSQRFHEKLGFRREGVLAEQHFDGAAYHDVIRYGLLANERGGAP